MSFDLKQERERSRPMSQTYEQTFYSWWVFLNTGVELLIRPDETACQDRDFMIKGAIAGIDQGIDGTLRGWTDPAKASKPATNFRPGMWIAVPPDSILFIGLKEGNDGD